MRLDGHEAHRHGGFVVWHCEECRPLTDVLWCDEELAQCAHVCRDPNGRAVILAVGELAIDVRQYRTVRIYFERRVVLVNEVEDPADDEETRIDVEFPRGLVRVAEIDS